MWAFARALLAAAGLVVSLAGFAVFAAAAVGVWWAKGEANRRADALAGRADAATAAADHAVGFVRKVIDQADQELIDTRAQAAAMPAEPVHPVVLMSARQASQQLAGSVDRASAAVATASDAVVVADAALQLFADDEELKTWLGVKPEQLIQLSQTRSDLGAATRDLKKARTVLGIPVAPGGAPTPEQLNAVAQALAQARGYTDQMGVVVATTRARVAETKQTVDKWVLRAAVGTTLLGALAAAGQVFAARFCWRVLRRKPA